MIGILFDGTRCTGCERCVSACVETNGLDAVAAARDRATTRDGLSANRPLSVMPLGGDSFVRNGCMHCVEPSCVSACLVGALEKTPEGPVVYDPDMCIGCRYCMLACPFHVPRYEWQETLPFVKKCSMCFDRLDEGGKPACVEVCPSDALQFGDRDALLAEAHQRIQDHPGRYLPRVWGESEWGGTSVLLLSDVDLGEAGWPESATASIPSTTEPLVHKTPFIGASVLTCTWALSAIIQRRQKLMNRGDAEADADASPRNES
jgi:formate dehydrogenase iron-sulfur subunit